MTEIFAARQSPELLINKDLFSSCPANPNLKICVILPVRNEEDNIVKALNALRLQMDCSGKPFPYKHYEVLLLANNCSDQSVVLARSYQKQHPGFNLHIEDIKLPAPVAHIGTVRRLLMDAAYERFSIINKPEGVIASTDSDSEVDHHWLYQTLTEIRKGNDVVGGRILTKPDKSISRLYYLRDITYKYLVSRVEDLLDPVVNDRWPRHFQCFGASFAVTCRMYDLSGRLPVVPFLEDMAFHKSLIRVDAKIRLSPLVQVSTSARIQGRVDFGLSIQLKQWGEMTADRHPLMVEPVGSLILKLNARKTLRDVWNAQFTNPQTLAQIGSLLGLEPYWIEEQMGTKRYFGELWESVEERIEKEGWSETWPAVDVVKAIPQLKNEIFRISSQLQLRLPERNISSRK
ncbi:glycosyltransferase family 2 protein [Dyadobacter arcticus]|uniref:Glycosyltransferase 2-like domain-containing protein n=1 Tax=Dyadobacter arcticus TaxID=1078754 RepID=A0ABX0UNJ7_9BACT|nr:glycosyltransferase [Dyadobacter arcticus]NIJ54502.1 hypothetical protein [Dyadobacter arcticus]